MGPGAAEAGAGQSKTLPPCGKATPIAWGASVVIVTFPAAAFERVRNEAFPPLSSQFEPVYGPRKIIDEAVLRTIGYTDQEIRELLPAVYEGLAGEMRAYTDLMRRAGEEEADSSGQLPLLPEE